MATKSAQVEKSFVGQRDAVESPCRAPQAISVKEFGSEGSVDFIKPVDPNEHIGKKFHRFEDHRSRY